VRVIDIDGRAWRSQDDFYDAIFRAIGAPEWHGRSLDALDDSMIWHDDINDLKAPYTLRIYGNSVMPAELRDYVMRFAEAINTLAAPDKGTELEISIAITD